MLNDSYRHLVLGLAELAGLADSGDALHEGGALLVDGVAISLHAGASVIGGACDRIDLFADFGECPEARGAEVMRRLLEVNPIWPASALPRWWEPVCSSVRPPRREPSHR